MRALEFENSPKFTVLKAKVKAVLDDNTEYTQLQAKMSEIDSKIAELNKQKTALLEDMYYLNNVTRDIERRVIFDTVEDPKDAEIIAYFY